MNVKKLMLSFAPIAIAAATLSGCGKPPEAGMQCVGVNDLPNTDENQRFKVVSTQSGEAEFFSGEVKKRTGNYVYADALKSETDENTLSMGWKSSGLGFNVYLGDEGEIKSCEILDSSGDGRKFEGPSGP